MDTLGQAFDERSFAHPRVAYHQHVGLESACQCCDHLLDLSVPANHRLETILFGQSGDVDTVFF